MWILKTDWFWINRIIYDIGIGCLRINKIHILSKEMKFVVGILTIEDTDDCNHILYPIL